jgi:hypothetical protein
MPEAAAPELLPELEGPPPSALGAEPAPEEQLAAMAALTAIDAHNTTVRAKTLLVIPPITRQHRSRFNRRLLLPALSSSA